MGQMKVVGGAYNRHLGIEPGHSPITWDVAEPETVTRAENIFGELNKLGSLSFIVAEDKSVLAQQVHNFDPLVENYIVIAPVAGG